MSFATFYEGIDWFEVVLFVLTLAALAGAVLGVKAGYQEFRYGLRDRREHIKLWGVVVGVMSFAFFVVIAANLQNTLVQFMVPSALQQNEPTLEVVASINVRVKDMVVVTVMGAVCWMLWRYRREADRLRKLGPVTSLAEATTRADIAADEETAVAAAAAEAAVPNDPSLTGTYPQFQPPPPSQDSPK